MGIDHVIAHDCIPKETFGVQKMIDLIKARSRANTILAMARQQGDARPPEAITFKVGTIGPSGMSETRDVSVGTLLAQSAPLDAASTACTSCRANTGRGAYGCYDSIDYPIRKSTEEWLISRLPPNLTCTAGQLLGRAMRDFGWDGRQAAAMRSQGTTFFEAPEADIASYGQALTISTNQIFHMLFHVGHVNAVHALMLCLFFGVVPHSIDPASLRDPRLLASTAASLPPAEGQIERVSSFLRSCASSAALGVLLLIDG